MKLAGPTPILRIFDEAKAREFYVDFLGFAVDWEHRFSENHPLYLQISRGDCVLHLSEHHGDACPGGALLVEMEGLDAYHGELTGRDYKYYKPAITEAVWGANLMKVSDPFGNHISFFERKE